VASELGLCLVRIILDLPGHCLFAMFTAVSLIKVHTNIHISYYLFIRIPSRSSGFLK